MKSKRQFKYLVGDFETTVYEGQTETEVWASAIVELNTEDVKIFHSIDDTYSYLISLNENLIVYYHNLKFDGQFWLSFLITKIKMRQSSFTAGETTCLDSMKNMLNNSFIYSISDMGQWYTITIKVNNKYIILRDSLKLLPFSVKRIGESFKTKHKKLDMEYKGYRYAGCTITDEEKKYIANDVFVVKEALEFMFSEGHNKLTIGSCCLSEFKKMFFNDEYNAYFPNLYDVTLSKDKYGSSTVGDYIHKSYRGGWCYLVKGKENKIFKCGITADVNSLYPSMMDSESCNGYPVGKPKFWKGNYIPPEALQDNSYYFIRIKTRFYLKENMLPFIQLKGNAMYPSTVSLESSDIYNKKLGVFQNKYFNKDGELVDTRVEMTMTMTDYILFREHYDVLEFEILDGCYFMKLYGLFDEYISKYKKIKLESKGAMRELAKLFLNNLYGKMASSTRSSFKIAYEDEDGSINFYNVTQHDKEPGYIPIGSAITSYARNFTIRAAQMNYYGNKKRGFIYADTDSIHCDLKENELKGIKVDDKNFCCWKLESTWDKAIFVRQKTYIEHVIEENLQPIDKPYYNVKCAGMPERCKQLFLKSMEGVTDEELSKYNEEEQEFLKTKRTLSDFKIGLKVYGKLLPKRIKGGVILVDTTYEMR